MANEIIILDGSGAGGGGGDDGFDLNQSAAGGSGGNGGSGSDSFTGTSTNEVIFGDGAGGGGGDGDGDGVGFGEGGAAGQAGSGADIINGGAGDDIIFGDSYNGQAGEADGAFNTPDGTLSLGGLGGGGRGGAGEAGAFNPATNGTGSATGQTGGTQGDPGGAGESGDNTQYQLDDTFGFYSELSSNLDAIAANTYSSSTFGTTNSGEGSGNDTIDGGAGSDQLFGNGGDDTFILDMEDDDGTTDTIWDFGNGSDTITIIDESDTNINITSTYDPTSNAATTGTANIDGDGYVYLSDGSQLVIKDFSFDTPAPCFLTGTAIATPNGEVAVETLEIGDLVTTADGKTAPVKWMGRREVSSVFAVKNASVQPILITSGALGNGLPTTDLRVSPDHAMFVDGVLIHAEALVNGRTIVQETMSENFTYHHIELENHELILANGAPAETFVDADVRGRFDNAAEYVALYGETESAAPMALPRIKSKRQLPAMLKAKLA